MSLASIRDSQGLSQSALASKASVSVGCLQKIEQGQKVGKLATLLKIAQALGVGIEQIIK